MENINCRYCGTTFSFDPAAVWTRPETIQGPQKGIPPSVVIQCPQCQQWIRVDLNDEIPDVRTTN